MVKIEKSAGITIIFLTVIITLILGIVTVSWSNAFGGNINAQWQPCPNTPNECNFSDFSAKTILNNDSAWTLLFTGNVFGWVSSLFSHFYQSGITGLTYGGSTGNPIAVTFTTCSYFGDQSALSTNLNVTGSFICQGWDIATYYGGYFAFTRLTGTGAASDKVVVNCIASTTTVQDLYATSCSSPINDATSKVCTLNGVTTPGGLTTNCYNDPYYGISQFYMICNGNSNSSIACSSTAQDPAVQKEISSLNSGCATLDYGCQIQNALQNWFTWLGSAVWTILAPLVSIILIILGSGLDVKIASSGIASNSKGTHLSQIMGISLLIWSIFQSEFGGWASSWGYGMSYIVPLVTSLCFFSGVVIAILGS